MFGPKRSTGTAEVFAVPFGELSPKHIFRKYVMIKFTSGRYLKQSSLSLRKILKVSADVLVTRSNLVPRVFKGKGPGNEVDL